MPSSDAAVAVGFLGNGKMWNGNGLAVLDGLKGHSKARHLLAANLVKTEFIADRENNLAVGSPSRDRDPFAERKSTDWIEIHHCGEDVDRLARSLLKRFIA